MMIESNIEWQCQLFTEDPVILMFLLILDDEDFDLLKKFLDFYDDIVDKGQFCQFYCCLENKVLYFLVIYIFYFASNGGVIE